jgi:hypothetical protein
MSAQLFAASVLVLLAGAWLLRWALRRARPAADPCAACRLGACGGCRPVRR